MTRERILLINLIAMITVMVSSTVFTISRMSRVFVEIEWQWAREAMAVFVPVAPFAGVVSLFVININQVFVVMPATEAQKLVVQTFKYIIYRGALIPFVVLHTHYQARLWSSWLIVIFSLKVLLSITSDSLQRVNAAPSATPRTYFRFNSACITYFTLLVNLAGNAYWMGIQMMYQTFEPSPVALLIFFEPLSIAFQTIHAMLVHGFQLIDIWLHHSPRNTTNSIISELSDIAAGLVWERKGVILRDVGFVLDVMSLLMSVGHYVHMWQLRGMTFHLVDAMLFLPVLSLVIAVMKRTWKFVIELKNGLGL